MSRNSEPAGSWSRSSVPALSDLAEDNAAGEGTGEVEAPRSAGKALAIRAPSKRVELSVVIPVYRSAAALPGLLERLEAELRRLTSRFEAILVDDCSPDDSWDVMKSMKATRPWLRIVHLLRNSGQHNAILCGFSLARGDIVVTMDDDLQNPPEELPKLVAAIDAGYDLAIGAYDSKKHGAARNLGGELVDYVQRRVFGLPPTFQLTSFRAARKVVVDNVVRMAGTFPYVTSMLLSHTSRCVNVPVHHDEREFGKSNYTLKRSVLLALNLLLTYSPYPLYLVGALCSLAFFITASFGIWTLWRAAFQGISVQGWASTIVIVSLLNALVLLALVIQAIYLSRLNQHVSRSRVSFTIGELHG